MEIVDLECIVMSCGEPTFEKCVESIKLQTYQPAKMSVIQNVSPINESINARHAAMKLPFSVKVDADMVLYSDCFEIMYEKLKSLSLSHYAVTALLNDPYIGSMGAVHMERTEAVKEIHVPCIIGCDRYVRNRKKKQNEYIWEMSNVVGEHWCNWSVESVFKRHLRVGQKLAYYKGQHYGDWIKEIGDKWYTDDSDDAFIALLGICHGLMTHDDKEKGVDFADKEWQRVKTLIEKGVIPEPTLKLQKMLEEEK